jgi:hypothetical protein
MKKCNYLKNTRLLISINLIINDLIIGTSTTLADLSKL